MKHISAERVVKAVQRLSRLNNQLFADFLILKFYGLSPTNRVVVTNTSTSEAIELLMSVRRSSGSEVVPGNPYFNPFANSGWRVADYGRTGPLSNIDGNSFVRVANTTTTLPREIALKSDYIDLMAPSLLSRRRRAPRIPLREVAIWVGRSQMYEETSDIHDVERGFTAKFHITEAETDAFFEQSTYPEDPFEFGPPDLDQIADLLVRIAPPDTRGRTAIPSEAEEKREQAKQELPINLLERIRGELVVPDITIRQLVTLIRLGKNVILTGPPGTGKTTLAHNLAMLSAMSADDEAEIDLPSCSGALPTTATADWTTFDTIGGYVPMVDGDGLQFREGLFLQAIRENKWLLVDELNRADADKAFGQLFTVLSGQEVELPFRTERGQNFAIRRDTTVSQSRFEEPAGDYVIGADWRIIATMNTFDRSHLFQLSSAFVRRFAIVNVPVPTLSELDGWLQARDLDRWALERVKQLITVLEASRPLGPALLRDFIDYISLRLEAIPNAEMSFQDNSAAIDPPEEESGPEAQTASASNVSGGEDPFLEAIVAYILPQMDGVDVQGLEQIRAGLRSVVAPASAQELDRHFRDLFRI